MTYKKYSMMFLGIAFGVSFWFIEALMHTLFFNNHSFSQNLIPYDINELWMRLFTFLLIIVFGIHANFLMINLEKSKKEKEEIQKRLEEALAKILSGYLPICANCKKIQKEDSNPDLQQSWVQIETYISSKSDAQFSHTICPECGLKLYGDIL
jgi:uncharacterized membrane protein YgaE (UPF0421/DUF939 family)